jgi:hypothetical protein
MTPTIVFNDEIHHEYRHTQLAKPAAKGENHVLCMTQCSFFSSLENMCKVYLGYLIFPGLTIEVCMYLLLTFYLTVCE